MCVLAAQRAAGDVFVTTFPGGFSRGRMCSRVHLRETHGFGFPCVVATCVHEKARSNQDRKTNTHRHKTHSGRVDPRDLLPLYQFTQPPRRPRCSWKEACGQHFTHACAHTCPQHMNHPSNLNYFMLLITSVLPSFGS